MIRFLLISILFLLSVQSSKSQELRGEYFIYFTDKTGTEYSLEQSEKFLSQRALDRRSRHHIVIDSSDLPVSAVYQDSLRVLGAEIKFSSRWFNGVFAYDVDSALALKIDALAFVKHRKKIGINKKAFSPAGSKFAVDLPEAASIIELGEDDYANSWSFIEMISSDEVHQLGYRGEDVLIAVLDAGFNRGQLGRIFDDMQSEGRLHSVYDFVEMDEDPWHGSSHGSTVSMFMAANEEGFYVGTAPKANYMLLRTEYVQSETLTEEYNWLAAAEYADSAGADVFNTSLSYLSGFSDTTMNHDKSDLDGDKTPITQAADIAASKGILLVNSAGNNGARGIGAPADADSTLAVGATNVEGIIANFSSRGPTADGRVKPDVVAFGSGVPAFGPGTLAPGNGTSYSGPIIAGASACLVRAFPYTPSMEIIDAIKKSASRATNPDNEYGYGIPNFKRAFDILSSKYAPEFPSGYPGQGTLKIQHNPVEEQLCLRYRLDSSLDYKLIIYSMDGRLVYEKNLPGSLRFGELIVPESINWRSGVYYANLETALYRSGSLFVIK